MFWSHRWSSAVILMALIVLTTTGQSRREVKEELDQGLRHMAKGNFEGAIILYSKLLENDANQKHFNSIILANRALCYQKRNLLIEALSDLNKSIGLNESYWKAYYRRATVNLALRNVEKAKEDLQKVLQLDSSKYINI